MSVWSTATPAGGDLLSQGDDKIREMKIAIQTALRAGEVAGDDIEGVEAIFPGASPSSAPVYRYRGLKGTTAERPTAGQYGFYYDTTRNVLQRDNGTSWDDIGGSFPSGTSTVFCQASAPVGWTAVAVNDKFLRVVTAGGTGGSTGGTVAASTSLAHSHTISSSGTHTHSTPAHSHNFEYTLTNPGSDLWDIVSTHIHSNDSDGSVIYAAAEGVSASSNAVRRRYTNRTQSGGSGTSGSSGDHSHGGATSSEFVGAFAYADVIIASKD